MNRRAILAGCALAIGTLWPAFSGPSGAQVPRPLEIDGPVFLVHGAVCDSELTHADCKLLFRPLPPIKAGS